MLQDIDLKYVGGVLTSGAALSVPALTVGGTQMGPPPVALPSDHGLLGWTADPTNASTNSTLSDHTLIAYGHANTSHRPWGDEDSARSGSTPRHQLRWEGPNI